MKALFYCSTCERYYNVVAPRTLTFKFEEIYVDKDTLVAYVLAGRTYMEAACEECIVARIRETASA